MKISVLSLMALSCVSASAFAAAPITATDNSGDCTQWAQEVEGSYTLEGCGSVEIRERPRGDIQDFDIYVGGVFQMPLLKVEFLSDKEMQVTPHTLQYSDTSCATQDGACVSHSVIAEKDDANHLTYIELHSSGSNSGSSTLICGKK